MMEAVRARRSVRRFRDVPVSGGVIAEMLKAARLAPTAGNAQGTVVGVVRDPGLKAQLAQAAGEQLCIASALVVFALCADIS